MGGWTKQRPVLKNNNTSKIDKILHQAAMVCLATNKVECQEKEKDIWVDIAEFTEKSPKQISKRK